MPLSVKADNSFQFSGFATLGITSENKDDLGFLRDSNQSKNPSRDLSIHPDSIIGAQLSSAFADNWRVTTQLAYRDRSEYELDDGLELAFLAYRPVAGVDLRLGRVAVDMFQLSDFRRVDYANLWMRPPTEVYAWILPSSIDGGDMAYGFSNHIGFWRIKLQYGNTKPNLEYPDGTELIEAKFNDFLVATFTLDFDAWRLRLSYSQATPESTDRGLIPSLTQAGALSTGPVRDEAALLANRFLNASGKKARYTQASISYDNGDWLLDTELAKVTSTGAIIPTGMAGYMSIGRRIGEITPYAVYSRYDSDQELYVSQVDWSTSGFEPLRDFAIGIINGVQIEQHTSSVGVRWDFAPKMAFKAQWDNTHIEKEKFALWAHSNDRSLNDTTVNLFSFALNFVF
ncbi:MAG: hypothetical protein JXR16_03750 [Bermanella sp.]